jgi:hypothetical protein
MEDSPALWMAAQVVQFWLSKFVFTCRLTGHRIVSTQWISGRWKCPDGIMATYCHLEHVHKAFDCVTTRGLVHPEYVNFTACEGQFLT